MPLSAPTGSERPVWCAYCEAHDLAQVELPLWELQDDFVVVCNVCRQHYRLKVKARPFLEKE